MKSSDKEFVAEADELLNEAASLLLDIQDSAEGGEPNPDSVNALFRSMHTLKGMSGLFGYQNLTDVSHSLENLLDNVRLGKAPVDDSLINFFFKYIDVLKEMVDSIRNNRKDDTVEVSTFLSEIESFLDRQSDSSGGTSIKNLFAGEDFINILSEYEEHRLKSSVENEKGIYMLTSKFSLEDFDIRLKDTTDKIKEAGELISTMPTSEGMPVGSIGFNLLFASTRGRDEITSMLGGEPRVLLKPKAPKVVPVATKEPEPHLQASATNVRVDISKLDRILSTIGELSIIRGSIKKLWQDMSHTYGNSPMALNLYRISQSFDRRLYELQDQVLEIRMVPVGQIFSRLGQVVRRYSRGANKPIDFEVFGEDTEIDKFLAEEVVDPLMHIVRNSIDHGIESADERKKAGKPATGNIRLKASQRGNNVHITVEDDGGGIRLERVRAKAIERKLIEASDELTDAELIDLMFSPGFSTASQVSETSGRGVGLDVVKEKLAALGGLVDVRTKAGEGSTFTLIFPITLAIIKALLVRVGSEHFALPLSSMNETRLIYSESIQTLEGDSVFNLRGEMLHVVDLGQLLGIERNAAEYSFMLVVGKEKRRIGLIVDEMMTQHEIVIKPLGDFFDGVRGIAGAAEVGSHEIVLVLDAESIIEESLKSKNIMVSG